MKKKILMLIIVMLSAGGVKLAAQFSSVSFNTLGLVTGNINVAFDFKINSKLTFDLPISISPAQFNKSGWANASVAPGFRLWVNNIYHGSFFGIYGIGGVFNFRYSDFDHKGWAAGAGASYGYSFLLSKRWNLDVELGAALVYTDYNKKENKVYGPFDDEYWSNNRRLMLIPSRARVSFSYLF